MLGIHKIALVVFENLAVRPRAVGGGVAGEAVRGLSVRMLESGVGSRHRMRVPVLLHEGSQTPHAPHGHAARACTHAVGTACHMQGRLGAARSWQGSSRACARQASVPPAARRGRCRPPGPRPARSLQLTPPPSSSQLPSGQGQLVVSRAMEVVHTWLFVLQELPLFWPQHSFKLESSPTPPEQSVLSPISWPAGAGRCTARGRVGS